MTLAECQVGDAISLTPSLTPIIGEAYLVGGPADLERRHFYVYPAVWKNDCWSYTNNPRLRIAADREVAIRE